MTRLIILSLLVFAWGCSPRQRYVEGEAPAKPPGPNDPKLVEIDLSSGVSEGASSGLFQLPAQRTYTGLVRALEQLTENKQTAGVFLKLGTTGIDLSRAAEIGDLLGRAREKRLPVVCHAHDIGNATSALLLRGCSSIWLSAAGSVDTVGIAAELVHLKGLLDRLKIQADFISMGRYKSGAEPLTRDVPSDHAVEELTATLGSIRESWLGLANHGRAGLGDKLEGGPYTPQEAKQLRLVDHVGFESEARDEAKKLAKTEFQETAFGGRTNAESGFDIGQLIQIISGGRASDADRPHIAVVPAEGAIGMESGSPLESGGISGKALSRTIARLRRDPSVKAVVLRIDSPGGSPLASDLVWHELMELRKKKPVVASVGSMAASGGYYIACAAQKIVAPPSAIVGSIGVFGGKLVVGEALKEIGVNTFPIPASSAPGSAARAAYLSPFRPWDEETRQRVKTSMQGIYDLFVERVASARKLSQDVVRTHAEGRIFSGVQGKERGLVDELGGLSTALEVVRKLGNLPRDTPVSVEGQRESLLDLLLVDESAQEADIRAAVTRLERARSFLGELPASVRAYAGVLAPLASGEPVVVALPFALRLR